MNFLLSGGTMQSRIFAVGSVLLVFGTAALTSKSDIESSGCGRADDKEMIVLLSFAKHIAGPSFASSRAGLNVPDVDAASIQVVTEDSTCKRAAAVINADRGNIDSTRTIYLLTLGGKAYWAKDPKILGGEYVQTYILDSALTKIVGRSLQ